MMMAPRPARPPREHVPVRLSAEGMARIRELATQETEGNVSQMIRKLLTEALQQRDAQKGTAR